MLQESKPNGFNGLGRAPLIVLEQIFSFLDQVDLHTCCLVSQWWHQVASRASTWRSLRLTYDNSSLQLAKQLANKFGQFLTCLTVDTSVQPAQLRALLKKSHLLLSFRQVDCRFNELYTKRIKGASNAEILAQLAVHCPQLQELILVQSSDITTTSLEAFVKGCTRLRHLDVGKSCLSPQCFALISRHLPRFARFTYGRIKVSSKATQLDSIGLDALMRCQLKELMIAVRSSDLYLLCQVVAQCSKLERFACVSAAETRWSDIDPLITALGSACPAIRTLILPEGQIQRPETLTALVTGCPAMEVVHLCTGSNITQSVLQDIGLNWKRLIELNLTVNNALIDADSEMCPFAGITKGDIKELKRLQFVCKEAIISQKAMTDLLRVCIHLTDLKLTSQSAGDSLLQGISLACPPDLTHLWLSPKKNSISAKGLAGLLSSVPGLRHLKLSRTDLTPRDVKSFVESLSVRSCCLETLCLTTSSRLTDSCLGHLGSLPCLTTLRLQNLKLITNGAVAQLRSSNACASLRHLVLHNGHLDDNLTNLVFDEFGLFTGLKTLELAFWSSLTNEGVAKLAGTPCAKSLTSLRVTGSALVTEEAITPLLQHRQLSFQYLV